MENYPFKEKDAEGADLPHCFRYYVARGYVEPDDKILDLACGFGAGSNILKRSLADSVVGMDYRLDCITKAKEDHTEIEFQQKDLNIIDELPPCTYSVSIETIEHLKDPERFADMLKYYTEERIFISTPIIPSKDTNEHHLHDFIPDDIIALFRDDEWRLFHWGSHGGVYGLFYFQKSA